MKSPGWSSSRAFEDSNYLPPSSHSIQILIVVIFWEIAQLGGRFNWNSKPAVRSRSSPLRQNHKAKALRSRYPVLIYLAWWEKVSHTAAVPIDPRSISSAWSKRVLIGVCPIWPCRAWNAHLPNWVRSCRMVDRGGEVYRHKVPKKNS